MIGSKIQEITNCNLKLDSLLLFLLNTFEIVSPKVRKLLMVAARMLMAASYSKQTLPTLAEWLNKSCTIMLMDKLTAIIKFRAGTNLAIPFF